MSDPNVLTTLSDAAHLNAPDYKEHVEAVLASYDNPTGISGDGRGVGFEWCPDGMGHRGDRAESGVIGSIKAGRREVRRMAPPRGESECGVV